MVVDMDEPLLVIDLPEDQDSDGPRRASDGDDEHDDDDVNDEYEPMDLTK